jgi:hypothetical protein
MEKGFDLLDKKRGAFTPLSTNLNYLIMNKDSKIGRLLTNNVAFIQSLHFFRII